MLIGVRSDLYLQSEPSQRADEGNYIQDPAYTH